MNIMKQKDLDFDLYKATNKLLNNFTNIESCLELYETEKVLLPLIFMKIIINLLIVIITMILLIIFLLQIY